MRSSPVFQTDQTAAFKGAVTTVFLKITLAYSRYHQIQLQRPVVKERLDTVPAQGLPRYTLPLVPEAAPDASTILFWLKTSGQTKVSGNYVVVLGTYSSRYPLIGAR